MAKFDFDDMAKSVGDAGIKYIERILGMPVKTLVQYSKLGPPSDLIRPVRCGECVHAEDVSQNPSDYLAPYFCHEIGGRRSSVDYCSYGRKAAE